MASFAGFRNSRGVKATEAMVSGAYDFFATGVSQARYDTAALRGMTPYVGAYRTPMSGTVSAVHGYGRNPRLGIGGGALAGLAIGTAYGHPALGLAAGVAGGAALRAGLGMGPLWKSIGQIPGGKSTVIAAAAGSVFMGARAFRSPEYGAVAEAVPDGIGGYNYDTSGVSQRLRTMGASGDMVFGLHNRR